MSVSVLSGHRLPPHSLDPGSRGRMMAVFRFQFSPRKASWLAHCVGVLGLSRVSAQLLDERERGVYSLVMGGPRSAFGELDEEEPNV